MAALIVSAFTTLSFLLAGNGMRAVDLHELLLLPLVCIAYGWPAVLVFLSLGVPTLYWLNRVGRLGLTSCVIAGAAFTALPWVALQIILRPERLRFLQMAPFFAVIGIGNGILTWLVVVRSHAAVTSGNADSAG